MWYLPILEQNLSEFDARELKSIWEPRVVGVQPEDSRRGIVVCADGEIRHYGERGRPAPFQPNSERTYLASRDCGLSWKLYPASWDAIGACVRSPWEDADGRTRWLTVVADWKGEKGVFALISFEGPDDTSPRAVKISDLPYSDMFQPKPLTSCRRWVCTMHRHDEDGYHPACAYSDDDGETWKVSELKSAPRFEVVYPHKGRRWENNGAEPICTELPDGRLAMLVRTSQDFFYIYYSSDHGETWSDGVPSRFHGTLTTPYFLELSDGRTVLFWNNTQPLPEFDQLRQPDSSAPEALAGGYGEDVFTNRDASHAAITEDWEHWTGFRELYLNSIRNAADFRMNGGRLSSADKSVHQFQAIELPFHKILVAVGQHEASRRLVIFDADWLYEKAREESFHEGLNHVSTHTYVKSVSGCTMGISYGGHCAWNRTNGPLLLPDPDGSLGEALHFARIDDARLFSPRQGMAWNFPCMYRGTVSFEIWLAGSGIQVSLCDRWFNPMDETVRDAAQYSFVLDSGVLDCGNWQQISIGFDCKTGEGVVFCGKRKLFAVRLKNTTENGISYLHLQSTAEAPDAAGCYIRKMKAE